MPPLARLLALAALSLFACNNDTTTGDESTKAANSDPAQPEAPKTEAPKTEAQTQPPPAPEPPPKPAFMSEPERVGPKGKLHADHERRKIDIAGLTLRGPKDAKVVILACVDFVDPYGKRGEQGMAEIHEAFPSDVAFYFRPYWNLLESFEASAARGDKKMIARRDQTQLVARALVAAERQGKLWELHDLVLAADREQLEREGLEQLASEAGLDLEQWKSALDDEQTQAAVAAHKQACAELGVDRGVPVYFINGRMMTGARRPEDLRYVVEVERAGGFELLPPG